MEYTREQQQANFYRAQIMGYMMDIVNARGGMGEMRKPLSHREKLRRKKYRQTVKASRKANR